MRLPDVDSLGRRPVPQSRKRVSSVRNAGIVADAAGGLGRDVAAIGNKMLEKEDRLAYAAAKSAYLKADVAARQEFENDNEYGSFDERYSERMKVAAEQASGLLKSKSDKALFSADIKVDFARGRSQVMTAANGKRIIAEKAVLFEGLESLRDTGRDALDEGTRTATISQANELLEAGFQKGLINPIEKMELREGWVSDYNIEQVRLMKNRGDVRGAAAYLEAHRDQIQGEKGLRLEEILTGDIEAIDLSEGVDAIMGFATGDNAEPVQYSDPLRGRGTSISSSYGVKRKSGAHNGTDFTGKRGSPVYSIAAGTATVGYDERSGHFVKIDHGNGMVSSYSHMDKPAVKNGDVVTPDSVIGDIGMSGKTTGPHVHVVVKQNGKTVDPETVIGAARQSPRKHDLNVLLGRVDELADAQNWPSQKREKYKTEVARRVSRDETLLRREESDASRQASEIVLGLGENFKSLDQIPSVIQDQMSPNDLRQYQRVAESNNKAVTVKANSNDAIYLDLLEIRDPKEFAKIDLAKYADKVTRGEIASLLVRQTKIIEGKEVDIRPRITSTIRVLATADMDLKGKDNEQNFINTVRTMEGILEGNSKPTRAELDEAFRMATQEVQIHGRFYGTNEKQLYELDIDNVPEVAKQRIIDSANRNLGREPTEEEILQAYQIQRARK